jgi:murein DD-endopeptidase MepM/ murein hydrolase activator NlpD
MSVSLSGRGWVTLLAGGVLVAGLFSFFHHPSDPERSSFVPRTLVTPTVPTQNGIVTATPTPHAEISAPVYIEAAPTDIIDIKKLKSSDVKVTVHTVGQGENYWSLAKAANIDIYTLIGANPSMPYRAALHQQLNILSKKGVLHTVEKDDTLGKIAGYYRTTEKAIKEANGLHWWWPMHVGNVLFIPNARPIRMIQAWKDYFDKRGMFGVPFSKWATWTSGFGIRVDPISHEERSHKGIDLRAKYGDPVYASAPGKVIFTGISGGYGNLIQIAHGHGYITFYGHLSRIYVKSGQKVRRGSLIGRVGATGRVTGPHLHFEIRLNGKALDPLQFI